MRCLLEWLQYIYNDLKDKNEITIYDKYGNIAKRTTIIFIGKKNDIFYYSNYLLILTMKLDML